MAKRVCANCGKEKDVYGGKVCKNDHFICSSCSYGRSTCPICGKEMKWLSKINILYGFTI